MTKFIIWLPAEPGAFQYLTKDRGGWQFGPRVRAHKFTSHGAAMRKLRTVTLMYGNYQHWHAVADTLPRLVTL